MITGSMQKQVKMKLRRDMNKALQKSKAEGRDEE